MLTRKRRQRTHFRGPPRPGRQVTVSYRDAGSIDPDGDGTADEGDGDGGDGDGGDESDDGVGMGVALVGLAVPELLQLQDYFASLAGINDQDDA